eukprot:scaffold472293_cov53-Prasinocladus_malaysianus.AAC.1
MPGVVKPARVARVAIRKKRLTFSFFRQLRRRLDGGRETKSLNSSLHREGLSALLKSSTADMARLASMPWPTDGVCPSSSASLLVSRSPASAPSLSRAGTQ